MDTAKVFTPHTFSLTESLDIGCWSPLRAIIWATLAIRSPVLLAVFSGNRRAWEG